MISNTTWTLRALILGVVAAPPGASGGEHAFAFRDVSQGAGILPHLSGMRGHSGAWGDADGDGWVDLYVGNFFEEGSKANVFLRNDRGRFRLDDQEHLRTTGCASGSIFVDLDNDGDLDFYLANVSKTKGPPATATLNLLFRNDGAGKFTDISKSAGASPEGFKGRSVAAIDYDGDGLLDLALGEDHSYGSMKRSRLLRNKGDLVFEDATKAAGLPGTLTGLGVAAGDVNDDGWPDLFLAGREATNVLFLNDRGAFREWAGSRKLFAWTFETGDDSACGVSLADVDRDGLVDLLVGHHYKRPWMKPVPIRLFLNRGVQGREPAFEEITEAAGLRPLWMKAPHVEIQDFDNDGWPDIYVSIVKFAGGRIYPVIFRNLGVRDGLPRFREDAWAVNDFPTADEKALGNTGQFFQKVIEERKIEYFASGPSADYDNDGKLDLLLVSWWSERGSLLLRNETAGGSWLQVQVQPGPGVNRMGLGVRINVYRAGTTELLSSRELSTGYGYASGQPAIAHFGLGEAEACDLEAILPHGKGRILEKDVKANQRVLLKP
ncbi:MAG: CRTAC1 family protein [Planctomycetes bacterium]|nr:CRTAC1 family protein [Planctomycetota bacterium]